MLAKNGHTGQSHSGLEGFCRLQAEVIEAALRNAHLIAITKIIPPNRERLSRLTLYAFQDVCNDSVLPTSYLRLY
jgi:hypothetical protein